jgi:hypothetical protein
VGRRADDAGAVDPARARGGVIERLIARLLPRRPAPPAPPVDKAADAPAPVPQTPPDEEARSQALRRAFAPSRPQRGARHFVGRQAELARILRAIGDERLHVVLYGERGRGKTSLVNLVAEAGRSDGYIFARYSCSAESDFDAIMRGLARDLPASLLALPVAAQGDTEGCEAALPAGRLEPRDIALLPRRLAAPHLVLLVDEFDRVVDEATRTRLADTIKQVSDRAVALSFLIVGVSENLEHLLGRHPSIQRNVVGVPLPLMGDEEILGILDRGARETGLPFGMVARGWIVALARGVPYVAQLLALRTTQSAMRRGAAEVGEADLEAAIPAVLAEMEPHLGGEYEALTRGGRDQAMEALLRAVASGPLDHLGRISAVHHVGSPDGRDPGQARHAALWRRMVEAGALRPCGPADADLHTFKAPMLPHYILLRAALAARSDWRA